MLDKEILKELATICRMLAKSSKNMKYKQPKFVKERCPTCSKVRTVRRYKTKDVPKDYSEAFLKKADIFKNLAKEAKW